MNFSEYESKGFALYSAFADKVRFLLEEALAASDLTPPQSIQWRAKGIESLRRRLSETEKVTAETIESERRDLAGARLIFYTNNDVDQFVSSSLISDNFEIEWASTRVHHPTPENEHAKYRAIHYTVRLREERARLPEYARFKGLRCEIQVQTILNHAWSETSHDILYKRVLAKGYGTKAMEGIARRLERIMDEFLIPAGYEFQKAQQEYARLLRGEELVDRDIAKALDSAANNNETYEILQALKDFAIPYYDDHAAAYKGLRGPLLGAVRAARLTAPIPITTIFGDLEGTNSDAVTRVVIEIINRLCYVDVEGTLQLLIDLYKDERSPQIQSEILKTVKRLAGYDFDVCSRVGFAVQAALLNYLDHMEAHELDLVRPIALAIWTEVLKPEISGQKWRADALELRNGPLPVSEALKRVRSLALEALFAAYDRSEDDGQRRAVLAALSVAARAPIRGNFSNEFLAMVLEDAKIIAEFVRQRALRASYQLKQYVEHQQLREYRRAKPIFEDSDNRYCCQSQASALIDSILQLREAFNADQQFVKYKVLVGFESVYPGHWTDANFDFTEAEEYRGSEVAKYIEEISAQNEDDWFELIRVCAATKSDDLATFPVFGKFIKQLAEAQPDIAYRLLQNASSELRNFLPGFLTGMASSMRNDIYERVLEVEMNAATDLSSVARHLRYSELKSPETVPRLLGRAIEVDDSRAVTECFLLSLEQYESDKLKCVDELINDALTYLSSRNDVRWINQSWFLDKATKFFDRLGDGNLLPKFMENLRLVARVDHHVESILTRIARHNPEAVWEYFGARLANKTREAAENDKYEAVPFEFFSLQKELSKDPNLAIANGRAWFARDRSLFQFGGGRVVSNVFVDFNSEFATAVENCVKAGGEEETDFALAILQNYRGNEAIHAVLREIVAGLPEDSKRLGQVRSCIDSTGMVSGDLGFADAWRTRRGLLEKWLSDPRQRVKAFAEGHIAELDRMIAEEHRRAEAEREMRRIDFDEEEPPE